jgi:hypothetical protein
LTDKPLHVRVAEALGCKPQTEGTWRIDPDVKSWACPGGVGCYLMAGQPIGHHLLRYDTNWRATGPLIERLSVMLAPGATDDGQWMAVTGFGGHHGPGWVDSVIGDEKGYGPTPLVAVCHLILALHAEGKL